MTDSVKQFLPVGIGILVTGGLGGLGYGAFASSMAGALAATATAAAVYDKPEGLDSETGTLASYRQPITHWQWIYGQTRVGGAITFIQVTEIPDHPNLYLHIVITLAGHEVEEIGDVYFDEQVVPIGSEYPNGGHASSGRYQGFATIQKSLGNETGQPFPELVNLSGGQWTDAHRQSGRAKLYCRLVWNEEVWQGIPNITAVVKGRKVLDDRTGLTVWSDNAALCIADYLRNPAIGLGCTSSEIDTAQLISAANLCDEAVPLATGGTEKRYTINGAFDSSAAPRDILPRLLTAVAGNARFISGQWKVDPASYKTPALTLTEDDLRGRIKIKPRLSRRELCNAVKGLYQSPGNNYQPTDFPPIRNSFYRSQDQGEEIWRELDLPFTNSAAMAQRIARIELERTRQQIVIEWAGKLSCYRLQPGDTCLVDIDRYGWDFYVSSGYLANEYVESLTTGKPFEVLSSQLVFEESDGGMAIGCDLVLRETAPTIYVWSAEETTVDLAPDTSLPNPFTVAVPGNPVVTDELVETRDGFAVKATVTWASPADALASLYQPEYRLLGAATWNALPLQTALSVTIFDIALGVYEFRVKAINVIGVTSAYSGVTLYEVLGAADIPATPTGVSLQIAGGTAIITLDLHPDLDVRIGGRMLVRHTEAQSSQSWEESLSVGNLESWPGDSVVIFLPLKPGSYLVKAQDSGGRESSGFALIVTKQASVLAYTQLATPLQEDTAFTGTKTDCEVVAGTLRLTEPDGVSPVGSYLFAAGFDFTTVRKARVTGQIEAAVFNALDLIDSRIGLIDDWLNFDGTTGIGSGADCWLETRHTDDNPSGSPTWTEWKRLDAGEFECRGMEFRLQMRSYDAILNLSVDVLRVKADAL